MDSLAVTIRVKALQPQRRRAGMLFTREPRDLMPGDLGEGIEAGEALLALVSDPQLVVSGIDADGVEHAVTAEMIEELVAAIEADRAAQQAERDAMLHQAAINAAAGDEAVGDDAAGPTEPDAEPAAAAPEPDPEPETPTATKPSGRGAAKRSGGKPAKG